MPLYEVHTTAGTLTTQDRERLAARITEVHVAETGAPPSFVHVTFPELPAGHAFTAGAPSRPVIVRGQIRAGRPPSVRQALLEQLSALCVEQLTVPVEDVLVAVVDVPASWAMEGGHTFPEPDPDAERLWTARADDASTSR